MYCYDVSSPAQRVIILNQPRLITWLVNPFQTLVKERQTRVLVGNKRTFLDEPTERLHLHQVHVELVVWLVTAFQKPYVHHTCKITTFPSCTDELQLVTKFVKNVVYGCMDLLADGQQRDFIPALRFFDIKSTAQSDWLQRFLVIANFCHVQTSRGQFEEVSHTLREQLNHLNRLDIQSYTAISDYILE